MIINCGPSRFIRVRDRADGSHEYRVEADVLPIYGRIPVPGAVHVHTSGIAPAWESWESIERRNHYPAGEYETRDGTRLGL